MKFGPPAQAERFLIKVEGWRVGERPNPERILALVAGCHSTAAFRVQALTSPRPFCNPQQTNHFCANDTALRNIEVTDKIPQMYQHQ